MALPFPLLFVHRVTVDEKSPSSAASSSDSVGILYERGTEAAILRGRPDNENPSSEPAGVSGVLSRSGFIGSGLHSVLIDILPDDGGLVLSRGR